MEFSAKWVMDDKEVIEDFLFSALLQRNSHFPLEAAEGFVFHTAYCQSQANLNINLTLIACSKKNLFLFLFLPNESSVPLQMEG